MPSTLKFVCLVAVLCCLQGLMACYTNLISNGSTEPLGDITLPMGSDLVINCTLNENYKGPRNASDIFWVIAQKTVPPQYIAILDQRSAQLRIQNISMDYCGKLSCKLKPSSTLCMNSVTIVAPIPEKDELNFSCTSNQWKSIKCEWKLSPRCPRTSRSISTNWTLSYSKQAGQVYCSQYVDDRNGWYGCAFDETTVPTYDVFMSTFTFVLSVQTLFEKKNFTFEVDHFSRVIASPPENLRNSSYESTKLKLVWNITEEFKLFPVPLVYQLQYRSEWDPSEHLKEIRLVSQTSFEISNLIPYTKYLVWLRCRSQKATDEALWSSYINGTFQTLSAVPVSQVNTTSANFIDISNGIDKRSVILYWKPIPRLQHFGPNFHYIIRGYSDGEKNTSNITNLQSFSYGPVVLLNDKSYWFTIQAANDLGVSPNVETMFIDKSSPKPPEAEDLTIFHLKSGVYNVTWKPPEPQRLVGSYFLVWCKGTSYLSRLQPCSAPLSWTSVLANETSRIITVDDKSESSIYHFGVAVNTNFSTSGLATWSKCIAPYDGIPGKMKMNPLSVESPTSIRVVWILDCTQQLGVITGFQVQYCSLDHQNGSCKGDVNKLIVNGAEKRTFSIPDLKPYTYYRITVAGMAKTHIGEACDPQTAMTKQAAPSDPPINLTSLSVSNTSITVHWGLPSLPNGVLTHFLVRYQNSYEIHKLKNVSSEGSKLTAQLVDKIECYTNYTITVQACTVSGCSPRSQPLTVLTEIGVPDQPEKPTARTVNYTHIVLEWEEPAKPNGPIEQWNLFVMKYANGDSMNSTKKVSSSPFSFPVQCDEDENVEYSFAIQAVTETKGHEKLISKWSELTPLNVCSPALIMGIPRNTIIIGLVVGVFAVLLIIVLSCYCYKSVVPKFIKVIKITAVVPEGLVKDGQVGYSDFEKKLNQSKYSSVDDSVSVKALHRLQSISSDEGRGSQNSEITLHEASSFSSIADENMYTDKTSLGHFRNKHNLSSDSSGCSTGEGSVSSAVTIRMHLSSDSGNEADLPTPVTSPDSVFYDVNAWPAGINCSNHLRLRTLQRLGEEDCASTLLNGERTDAYQPEKEDLARFTLSHSYQPVIKKSDGDATSVESNSIDSGPMGESDETRTNTSPLTMYSRIALITPPQSNAGCQKSATANCDAGAKDLKANSGICANPVSESQGVSKRPASYVALAILSDTNRVQNVTPSEELVRRPTNELTPYSCVGLLTNPRPITCSNGGQTATTPNYNVHEVEVPDVSGLDAAQLPRLQGSQQMPACKTNQMTVGYIQKKPKRPSYIALARIEDPSGSKICQSGYSKVGLRDTLTNICLPKAKTNDHSGLADKGDNVIGNKSPMAPAIHRYVTLGLMNPGSLKEAPLHLTDAKPDLNGCKLSFDPTLVDAGGCNVDDWSSWESELDISEENLTEEDLHVSLGIPSNEGKKL